MLELPLPVRLALGVPVVLALPLPVLLTLGVLVVLALPLPVLLTLGEPVLLPLPVKLALGVPVVLALTLPVLLTLGVPVVLALPAPVLLTLGELLPLPLEDAEADDVEVPPSSPELNILSCRLASAGSPLMCAGVSAPAEDPSWRAVSSNPKTDFSALEWRDGCALESPFSRRPASVDASLSF